jgi:hypothetical protein
VFNGTDLCSRSLKTRTHARITDHQCRCGKIDYWIEIDTPKNNTSVWRCWTQHHSNFGAGVKTNSSGAYQSFECALFEHMLEENREGANFSTSEACSKFQYRPDEHPVFLFVPLQDFA